MIVKTRAIHKRLILIFSLPGCQAHERRGGRRGNPYPRVSSQEGASGSDCVVLNPRGGRWHVFGGDAPTGVRHDAVVPYAPSPLVTGRSDSACADTGSSLSGAGRR